MNISASEKDNQDKLTELNFNKKTFEITQNVETYKKE